MGIFGINKSGNKSKINMMPSNYPASRVLLNNNGNVESAITTNTQDISTLRTRVNLNDIDAPFDITAVTPSKYTLLVDGYLYVQTELAGSSAVVRVYGSSETNYVEIRQSANPNVAASVTMTMFCKKGMKVSIISKSSDASVKYIPLK